MQLAVATEQPEELKLGFQWPQGLAGLQHGGKHPKSPCLGWYFSNQAGDDEEDLGTCFQKVGLLLSPVAPEAEHENQAVRLHLNTP